ncbi:MAG TPA: hypothetical protein VEG30_15910, partial [Terriglobales bacterium]|nr:hypothetical protein [Terriglobales bacterium]
SDPDAYMRRVFGEESGLARSVNFTESAITMSNLLGQSPKARIPDWNAAYDFRAYLPKRTAVWHGGSFTHKPEAVIL